MIWNQIYLSGSGVSVRPGHRSTWAGALSECLPSKNFNQDSKGYME
jgi:hypothetical protein